MTDSNNQYRLGVDVGSTTVKLALLDAKGKLVLGRYERHRSDIAGSLKTLLEEAAAQIDTINPNARISASVTGSAGIGVAERLDLPFVQEVSACAEAVERILPSTDVAIELGGEDAKITYFGPTLEERMNGSCAGGTGAFIDQMATLLDTDTDGLNVLAEKASTIYPIASRCGVFAKADIQPLINEGARREDIAASVFQAVVDQTISGLACGRPIRGHVALLGGPLHYLPELRKRFILTLKLGPEEALIPSDGRLFVAIGAALSSPQGGQSRAGASGERSGSQQDGQQKDSLPLEYSMWELAEKAEKAPSSTAGTDRLPPLFADEAALETFRQRHAAARLPHAELAENAGPVFVGIDAGSTTTKVAATDEDGKLLYSYYANNKGHPLEVAIQALDGLYKTMPPSAYIGAACATGYGEGLVKAALGADYGEVETVAHCAAARTLSPHVEAVLDIGGQDMKFLRVKDGVISSILLNEACSSGCGSFLETFARSMGYSAEEFSRLALESRAPVDLGSRCTVFMNSRVKQAQKEGASPADIAAGLAYSVIKNALQKVIRIRNPRELGEAIVVQGGTFSSEAVLRAFEFIAGREVIRPVESGLMGAYGAALIALRRSAAEGPAARAAAKGQNASRSAGPGTAVSLAVRRHSTLLGPDRLGAFRAHTESSRCKGCGNSCLLTITSFEGASTRIYITGNRCERGAALAEAERAPQSGAATAGTTAAAADPRTADQQARDIPPDLYVWKYQRIFQYKPLKYEDAPRGAIGIPRVLNMYENYPFWFTLFTKLGFRVELSPRSSKTIYEKGMESIPSESACYPAKLVHGHIQSLIERGVPLIFYPCVPQERRFVAGSNNVFNCPIVTSYPEVIRDNVEGLKTGNRTEKKAAWARQAVAGAKDGAAVPDGPRYLDPFLPIASPLRLARRLVEELADYGVTPAEAKSAVRAAGQEQAAYRADVAAKGEEALRWIEEHHAHGIVLAGRPYHVDPEINHGISGIATGLGMAVLTEDSVAHLAKVERPLRVVDQWAYHSRLYAAASFVMRRDDLDLLQLTSFGCGVDAVTSDQVAEILARTGKIYSSVKIDEHANLGAARIRLRSLAAAIAERESVSVHVSTPASLKARPVFTKEMRKHYTLLAPQMAPIQFALIEPAFRSSGYRLVVVPRADKAVIDEGLTAVHNDACFPSILVVGQILSALKSGQYDLRKTAVVITQTGGGCRATNYIGFIRKALADSGFGYIPVISVSAGGLEHNPGFAITPRLVWRSFVALVMGDLLMRLLYRTRPYEAVPGSADALEKKWEERGKKAVASGSLMAYLSFVRRAVAEFDTLPLVNDRSKPRIGVVGEILVKFHPDANGEIVKRIEQEGGEAVVPDLFGFLFYSAYNSLYRRRNLAGSRISALGSRAGIAALEAVRAPARIALLRSRRFDAPPSIYKLASGVDGIIQLGNCTGEGWFLTAEMVELINGGISGIACVQPFACLPNHVTGKGVLKELRRRYPLVPISPIDYDPGASEVNQENRLKLLMTNARRAMK